MVKGVSRRVVVVKSPDQKWFEQAIFLLREEAPKGAPEEQVLKRAQEVADAYLMRTSPRARRRRAWVPVLWALVGGAVASGGWLLATGILPLPF